MMKHKKCTALLLALCTILNMTACADSSSSAAEPEPADTHTEQTEPEETSGTGAEAISDSSTAVAETVTLPADEAPVLVKQMQSVSIPAGISAIVPAGGSKAAVSAYNGTCYIVDMAADQIVRQVKLNTAYERVIGVNADGTELITLNLSAEETVLRFYATADGSCTTLNYDGLCYEFDYDRSTDQVYGRNSFYLGTISKQGTETECYTVSDKEKDSIYACFMKKGLVLESRQNNGGSYSTDVRRVSDKKLLFSIPTHASTFRSCTGSLLRFDTEQVYGTQNYQTNCTVFDAQTGSQSCAFGVSEGSYPFIFTDEESRCMIVCTTDEENAEPKTLLLFDAQNGKSETLPFDLKNGNETKAGYLPALGCWAAAVTYEQGADTYSSSLYRIDPTQAKFSQEAMPLYGLDSTLTTELGSDLKAARDKADAIEQKYGIRILIGNEVNGVNVTGYRIVSTEVRDGKYSAADITGEKIVRALNALDGQLARYPKGFFDMFRAAGQDGLRISLVATLLQWDPNLAGPAAVAYTADGYENIVMDWTETEGSTTFHHELFHTVEAVMEQKNMPFDADQWAALNPSGFAYYGFNGVPDLPNEQMPIIGLESQRETGYFTRPYGMTDAKEDRATIAEYCFTEWFGVKGYDYIQTCPHVKAKLDYMEQMLKDCFGKSYFAEIFRSSEAE